MLTVTRNQLTQIVLASILILSWQSSLSQTQDEAAVVAKNHASAFLLGDYEAASKLTHPEVLAKFRQTTLSKFDTMRDTQGERDLYSFLGVKDRAEAEAMPAGEFFKKLSDKARPPDTAYATYKSAQLEVDNVQAFGTDSAAVWLIAKQPAGTSPPVARSITLLRKHEGNWKVVANEK